MVKIIDVSAYQIIDSGGRLQSLDWSAIADEGYAAAICKSGDGIGSPDHSLAAHVAGARAAGLAIGTYHYLRIRHGRAQDARAQAREACAAWLAQGCELRLALDVESAGNEAASTSEWSEAVVDFVAEVETQTGHSPTIYTSRGEWRLTALTSLGRCPLWLACYGDVATAPAPWHSYDAWQWTGEGKIAKRGPYDLSRASDEGYARLLAQPLLG